MFWKGRVKAGSHIIIRPWGGAEYSVVVKEVRGSGRNRRARVSGHEQVNGQWFAQSTWTREVK